MIWRRINRTRHFCHVPQIKKVLDCCPSYFELAPIFNTKESSALDLISNMVVFKGFITKQEEKSLLEEVDPYLQRMRYEYSHWDDAIHGFRETERSTWQVHNVAVLDRVRLVAFPQGVAPLEHVHVLDLAKTGHIKPHVDAVRFCGDTIAGLSLLSNSVMRLVHDKDPTMTAKVLLKRRSLYVMKGIARYEYKHEILRNEESEFNGRKIMRDRRISIICRNQPKAEK